MSLRRLLHVALLGSAAFLLLLVIEFPLVPGAEFLKYDPSEVPTLIAALALGPGAGVAAEAVKAGLLVMLRPGGGGVFGVFMNFLAGATLVAVAGWLARGARGAGRLSLAMVAGTVAMTAVMIVANVVLTPVFYGIPRPEVVRLVLPALLPFNVLKGALSSLIALAVYARVRASVAPWAEAR